jgi:hypothetical protein
LKGVERARDVEVHFHGQVNRAEPDGGALETKVARGAGTDGWSPGALLVGGNEQVMPIRIWWLLETMMSLHFLEGGPGSPSTSICAFVPKACWR